MQVLSLVYCINFYMQVIHFIEYFFSFFLNKIKLKERICFFSPTALSCSETESQKQMRYVCVYIFIKRKS